VGLEIKPAKLSDAGNYLCQLKNPLGEDESTAKASVRKVYQAPSFTQKFTDLQQVSSFWGFYTKKHDKTADCFRSQYLKCSRARRGVQSFWHINSLLLADFMKFCTTCYFWSYKLQTLETVF
jgi:hypothetical protein